ncbi:hypothetical protein PMG11_11083 [Penicillium brasilianum]|uniref:Uncharacterized protein n=1 Tax=Penicillium brasilianum TaxID=104259 RepID=A0A0F7U2V3_PENBI|nr:hypothetical protein PMG11_11083 [Penicillium brasilianum]
MLRAHYPTRTVEEQLQELFKDAKPCVVPDTTFARTVDRALRACFALLKFTDHIQVAYVEGSTGKSTYSLIRDRICLIYIADGWTLLVRTTGRSTGRGLRTTSPTRTPRSSAVMWWKSSWSDPLHSCSNGPDYHVVLHDDKRANAETALLHEKAALPNDVVPCGCRQQFARQTHRMKVLGDHCYQKISEACNIPGHFF